MTLKALKERRIDILGGDQVINLIYVEDVVEAILTSLFSEKASKEVFNVGSYDNITVREVVHRIAHILKGFKREVRIDEKGYLESDTRCFKPNISKITKVLSWKPQTNLNAGLSRTVEYYLKSQALRKNAHSNQYN
jgi:nucleoside-diphosphate-sugar epimerase